MAVNEKEPQLQLESLRLLNYATSHSNMADSLTCLEIAQAGGITILTKLLG